MESGQRRSGVVEAIFRALRQEELDDRLEILEATETQVVKARLTRLEEEGEEED